MAADYDSRGRPQTSQSTAAAAARRSSWWPRTLQRRRATFSGGGHPFVNGSNGIELCAESTDPPKESRTASVGSQWSFLLHLVCQPYHCPPGGSLSTLVNQSVTLRKKPVTHYPRGGGWITPNFGHFPYKRLKKKKAQKIFPAPSAPGFCVPHP